MDIYKMTNISICKGNLSLSIDDKLFENKSTSLPTNYQNIISRFKYLSLTYMQNNFNSSNAFAHVRQGSLKSLNS